jgi:phage baseplate assembly protein W
MLEVAFPYHLDDRGRTATTDYDAHVRQMLELLLLTRPGERVNRPDFGCGLLDLVFGPNSPEVAAALSVTITAAVGRWLGDVISLTALDVAAEDSTLSVSIAYDVLATGSGSVMNLSIPSGA